MVLFYKLIELHINILIELKAARKCSKISVKKRS